MTGKYSNLLTVLLVIAILGIFALLIFLGIDLYNKYYLEKETEQGYEQFDALVQNVIEDQIINDIVEDTNTVAEQEGTETEQDPYANIENNNTPNSNATPNSNPNSTSKVKYKGFVQVGTINIPSTNLKSPILEVASTPALEVAVGIQYGPGLNKPGVTVIAGHNYRNGTLFSNNKKIQIGDKIYIKDTSGTTVTYIVYDKFETTDQDTSYITRDTGGKREIALYSCNDDSSKRIVILAKEQS